MERNPNDNFDSQTPGSTGGTSGSSGMSGAGGYGAGAGGTSGGSLGTGAGMTGGASGAGMGGSQTHEKISDKARDKMSVAKEKAQSGIAQARDKAGELKNSLADKLDAGADRLRQRQGGGEYAGATAGTMGDGSIGVSSQGNMERVSGGLASGMHNTAEWLRENDLDSVKQNVEQQVRDHPGRTLLIAAGLGYLIGKAFRR